MREMLLAGKVAIVTGAASGMGKCIASLFHAHGASVVLADLDGRAAQAVVDAWESRERALALETDVADEVSVTAMVETVTARLGGIDILVNCAGVPQPGISVEQLDTAHWDRILNVNARSIFLTAKHAVPHMRQRGGGAMVNVASIVGVRAKPGQSAYCASKAAAIALSQSLALELAPDRIRVNVINPGAAETPMLAGFLKPGATSLEDGKKAFASNIPLGELIQPEDVAEAALYLASNLSRQVTGAVLNVDGGRSV